MKINLLFLLPAISLLIACGGESDDPAPDCNTSDLSLQLESSSPASCGVNDGELVVMASGGAGEYEYSTDSTTFQSSGTFTGLAANSYTIIARDANDCTKSLAVNIRSKSGINIESASTVAGCDTNEGSITLTASGGVEPYQFKLDNGAFGDSNSFPGLTDGTYSVTAQDAEGCAITQQVEVESGISYAQAIAPIIEANCAVSGCHAGAQAPDFRQFNNIQENAGLIKTKTGDGSMPQDGTLTEEQIASIACWVDDGAKDN